jgi:hypothetical protein
MAVAKSQSQKLTQNTFPSPVCQHRILFRSTAHLDRAAPQPEMVNAPSDVLRKGTIPAAGGYGLVTAENGEERENAKRAGSRTLGIIAMLTSSNAIHSFGVKYSTLAPRWCTAKRKLSLAAMARINPRLYSDLHASR